MKKIFIAILVAIFATFLYASKSISIDLSKQKIYAKEDGRVVFSGPISSGKSGHATPRGSFRILEKDKFHISSKYPKPRGGAKMPYMLRLTKSGIAVHQGHVPGYPASHGCIRVPKSTAIKLWRWSRVGTRVTVYGSASNFRYAKKEKRKKIRYAKAKSYKYRKYKSKVKRKYAKRKSVSHRHYAKKRRVRKVARYYAKRDEYEIVEIYDSW